jgi:Rod binding domain-containing protein
MSLNIGALSAAIPDSTADQNPKRLPEAARQFEALMITQIMKSARESSGGGWLSDGDETGEDTSMGMAEEQFAQSMAKSGGFGLANMIVKTMSAHVSNAENAAASPSAHAALTDTK